MKKSKRILLVLGIILIGTVLLFGYCYPFGGKSLSMRNIYIFNHKDQLHLSNDYHYKIIQYHQIREFASFVIIEFESEYDL